MIIGHNLSSRGCGFKSRHHILDGHDIFQLICCKKCIVCLKRPNINEKIGRGWPIFLKKDMVLKLFIYFRPSSVRCLDMNLIISLLP